MGDDWVIIEKSVRPASPWFIGSGDDHGNLRRGTKSIPGRTIRGMLAWQAKRIGDEGLFNALHSGEVHVMPGIIEEEGRRSVVPPITFQKCKRRLCRTIVDVLTRGVDDFNAHESEGVRCRHPTKSIDGEILLPRGNGGMLRMTEILMVPSIESQLSTHISIDRETLRTGTGVNSDPFQYQSWSFRTDSSSSMELVIRVGCKVEHGEDINKLLDSLDHTNAIGGARGKGYGRIIPSDTPASDVESSHSSGTEEKKNCILVLQSPLSIPGDSQDDPLTPSEFFVQRVQEFVPDGIIGEVVHLKTSVERFTQRGQENGNFEVDQKPIEVISEGSFLHLTVPIGRSVAIVGRGLEEIAELRSAGYGAISLIEMSGSRKSGSPEEVRE